MKVSHSQLEKWRNCRRQWKLHYVDRIRGKYLASPLFFGNACDDAFSSLLATKFPNGHHLTDDDKDLLKWDDPYKLFTERFTNIRYNGKDEYLPTSTIVQYSGKDWCPHFLNDSDIEELDIFYKVIVSNDEIDHLAYMEQLVKEKKDNGWKNFSEGLIRYYNYAHWLSLKQKGYRLIEAYKEQVLPQILRVWSIQKRVNLDNECGDTLTGIIDFTAEFIDEPGVVYTIDNKTASKLYKKDAVVNSNQLMTYGESQANENASYIVVSKDVVLKREKICQNCGYSNRPNVKSCTNKIEGKRCGGEVEVKESYPVKIQILRDKLIDHKIEEVFSTIQKDLDDMKAENYEVDMNDTKKCFQFGRKCIYYNVCHKGILPEDDTGLICL